MKKGLTHLLAIAATIAVTAATAAAQNSRLLAQSHYNAVVGNPVAYDSQQYVYPNINAAVYDQKKSYLYNNAWILMKQYDYTYNATGSLTNMVVQNWNNTTNMFENGSMTFYFLNAAGYCIKDSSVLWVPANNAYRNATRNIYTLNAAGQIVDQVYDSYDFGTNGLLHYYHYVNTYNTQGKPLVRLTQDWDASYQWMDYVKSTYVYDATGINLQTITGQQSTSFGNPLQNVYQNVYTLNPNGTVSQILSNIWNSSTNMYKPNMKIIMAYDANGNNTTETWEQWDVAMSTYKPNQQYIRTYNAANQKTSETRMLWSNGAYSMFYGKDNWYYEPFNPTAVASLAETDTWISLSPIPAVGVLHISLRWESAQSATVVITDMSGKVCLTRATPEGASYVDDLDIRNLMAGNYVLHVKGSKGSAASRIISIQQ